MRVIERLLEHFGNSQSKAAEAIGASQPLVNYWLRHSTDVPIKYFPKIAKAMGVKPLELLPPDFFPDD